MDEPTERAALPEDDTVEYHMRAIVDFAKAMHLEIETVGVEGIDSGAVLSRMVVQQQALAESVLLLVDVLNNMAQALQTPGDG